MKSGAGFVGSSVLLVVAQMLSNVLVIRWLEPHDAGLWQTLMLIQSYAGIAQLGLFSGLNRELPYQLGQDHAGRAHLLVATTQTHAGLCAAASVVISLGALLLLDLDPLWQLGVATVGLSAAANFYVLFLAITYRGTENFSRLTFANGLQALVAVASIPMVLLWGFEGLCGRIALMAVGWVFLLHIGRPVRVSMSWDWGIVRELLRAGGPAFGLGYLLTVASGFDRVLLLDTGGVMAVGLYAPALAVRNGLVAVPAAINAYVSPKMSRRLGQTNDPRAIWGLTWKTMLLTTLVMLPLVAFGWWAMPWLIQHLFPNYEAGIPAAQMLSLCGLFLGSRAATSVLTSLKAWWELAALNGSALVCFWLIPWHFAHTCPEGPLYGVALGWVSACALLFPIGFGMMYLATHRRPR